MTKQIRPNHYKVGKYEVVKIIDAWELNFNLGNVLKYVLRPGKSPTVYGRIEDLIKAKTYLEFEICRLKKSLP